MFSLWQASAILLTALFPAAEHRPDAAAPPSAECAEHGVAPPPSAESGPLPDHELDALAARLGVPNDTADRVLGQPGMSHPFINRTDGRGLVEPTWVAVDASVEPYRLYVVDAGNGRVLGYRRPVSERWPVEADLVLGQPDLHTAYRRACACVSCGRETAPGVLKNPVAVAVDPRGHVYVSDAGAHRVLVYERPFETDTTPDRVLGQGGCLHSAAANPDGVSATSLASPTGLAIDPRTGHLWVADTANHRVLRYPSPLSSDRPDVVIGQVDFDAADPNAGGLSARSLQAPTDVAVMGDELYVTDRGNHRVLVYRAPFTKGMSAVDVIGQDGRWDRAESGCSPFRLRRPAAVAVVPSHEHAGGDRVFIADTVNHRVLMFDRGVSGAARPTGLLGQGRNLHACEPNAGTINGRGIGPETLASPMGMGVAPDGTVWIADSDNHRVLGYQRTGSTYGEAAHVIGQRDLRRATANYVDGAGLSGPRDVAVDRSVNPNRLYVCDADNHRILAYASVNDLGPETAPALVIGQPDAFTNEPGTSARSLFGPSSIAVDADGGLFVADRDNNRVLYFENPFETGAVADRVFGQPDFTSREPNHGGITARSLHRPEAVAVDAAGNLYVADTRNHRVLRFGRPFASRPAADAVWGQGGRFDQGREFGGGHGAGPDTFSYPFGIALRDDGAMGVADANNHRVLLFDRNAANPLRAIHIWGQRGDLAGRRDNNGGCSARSLSGPENVLFHGAGLFIADTANCRVLYFDRVRDGTDEASFVYGQSGSFTKRMRHGGETGPRTLWFPSGMDLDDEGSLYVADREQNRVLVFRREPTRPGNL